MLNTIKSLVPKPIKDWYWKKKEQKAEKLMVEKWIQHGKPMPAPRSIKGEFILSIAKNNNAKTFVETGTHKGQTVEFMRGKFDKIFSIELNDELYRYNVEQFKKYSSIEILHGDSGEVLCELLPKIKSKAVFWLDGHYDFTSITSKGELVTPIRKELQHIAANNLGHVILIDDARLFDGTSDYPTIEEVKMLGSELFPGYKFNVELDIIIMEPK